MSQELFWNLLRWKNKETKNVFLFFSEELSKTAGTSAHYSQYCGNLFVASSLLLEFYCAISYEQRERESLHAPNTFSTWYSDKPMMTDGPEFFSLARNANHFVIARWQKWPVNIASSHKKVWQKHWNISVLSKWHEFFKGEQFCAETLQNGCNLLPLSRFWHVKCHHFLGWKVMRHLSLTP